MKVLNHDGRVLNGSNPDSGSGSGSVSGSGNDTPAALSRVCLNRDETSHLTSQQQRQCDVRAPPCGPEEKCSGIKAAPPPPQKQQETSRPCCYDPSPQTRAGFQRAQFYVSLNLKNLLFFIFCLTATADIPPVKQTAPKNYENTKITLWI